MKRLFAGLLVLAAMLAAPLPGHAGPACGRVEGIDDLCPAWTAVYDSDRDRASTWAGSTP